MTRSALISFSGGQDSTTCLFWALKHYDHVQTMGFDYGQTNHVELNCRANILQAIRNEFPEFAERLGEDAVIDVRSFGQIAQSALTGNGEKPELREGQLPTTFVPGRNLMFWTYAAARAYLRGIHDIVAGVGEADFSGYPDCRRNTLDALEQALSLGMDYPIKIVTPLMHRTKAQTWALAHELGGDRLVNFIVEYSHTCYEGDRTHHHAWGRGCGKCPACVLRAKGFEEFLAMQK